MGLDPFVSAIGLGITVAMELSARAVVRTFTEGFSPAALPGPVARVGSISRPASLTGTACRASRCFTSTRVGRIGQDGATARPFIGCRCTARARLGSRVGRRDALFFILSPTSAVFVIVCPSRAVLGHGRARRRRPRPIAGGVTAYRRLGPNGLGFTSERETTVSQATRLV